MKDAFNEGLPYITHSVVLHLFLRRPHILLTLVRHLTLINSNLLKQKFQPSLLNKVQTIPYFQCIQQIAVCIYIIRTFFTVMILNIFVYSYCCNFFVIKYFLLTSSSDIQCILCCTMCCYMFRVLSHICSKKEKNEIKNQISGTSKIILDLYFILEFTIIIFILFF